MRVEYRSLPPEVRAAAAFRSGAAAVSAEDRAGGFSGGVAARLVLADGRRVFLKGCPEDHPIAAQYDVEAWFGARMPDAFPRTGGCWRRLDAAGWFVLLFEDVFADLPGGEADLTDPADLAACRDLLNRLASAEYPAAWSARIPLVGVALGHLASGWARGGGRPRRQGSTRGRQGGSGSCGRWSGSGLPPRRVKGRCTRILHPGERPRARPRVAGGVRRPTGRAAARRGVGRRTAVLPARSGGHRAAGVVPVRLRRPARGTVRAACRGGGALDGRGLVGGAAVRARTARLRGRAGGKSAGVAAAVPGRMTGHDPRTRAARRPARPRGRVPRRVRRAPRPLIEGREGFVDLRLERCVEHPSRFLLLVRWSGWRTTPRASSGSAEYGRWRELLHHFYDPFPEVTALHGGGLSPGFDLGA
ncbi:hypothetical protein ACU686_17845 [Yinghuangia aomiensis]